MQGDAMRILPVVPYVELSMGHVPCERFGELGGGAPCEFSLWHRKWGSQKGTLSVRGVPKLAG